MRGERGETAWRRGVTDPPGASGAGRAEIHGAGGSQTRPEQAARGLEQGAAIERPGLTRWEDGLADVEAS